jgi:DNA-binding IclR family transcriptional regulator
MATDKGVGAPARKRRVQAVDHAIDILECLAATGGAVGVSELARQSGLSKATVYHLLATLEARRLVIREPDSASYRLGWALYEMGIRVARATEVTRVARPFLDQLASETGESVLLGVLDEDAVLYLERGDAPSGFHMVAAAGIRSPLHSTASGKLLLAYAGEEEIDRYLGTGTLESFTANTLTDPKQLRAQLEEIRESGYATCWQERELGLCSVAVGLRDHSGATVASLTLAGPAGRVTEDSVDTHLQPLRDAAANIDALLGYTEEVTA